MFQLSVFFSNQFSVTIYINSFILSFQSLCVYVLIKQGQRDVCNEYSSNE